MSFKFNSREIIGDWARAIPVERFGWKSDLDGNQIAVSKVENWR